MKKIIALLLGVFTFSMNSAFADRIWVNDLRTRFLNNSAIIMEVNPRTFNAHDGNRNGIIEPEEGDESSNFLNGVSRLNVMSSFGVNTLLLMPINELGKVNAMGTAGSLYAVSDFTKLNPQLVSKDTILTDIEQAKRFIREAHNQNIRIMVDLPAFGAYDLYLKRPELFTKDKNGEAIIPNNQTDVRLLDAGNDIAYNKDVFEMYKQFVDLMLELEVDGIRACEPATKTANFWKDLIIYSHKFDPQMLWLAQSSDFESSISNSPINTSNAKLLDAGFDGYYGFYNKFAEFNNAKDFTDKLNQQIITLNKRQDKKAILGAFSTHDDLSPILLIGPTYAAMQYWLNATLPINSYILDGNHSGDNFIYPLGNKKAKKSETDDTQYFVNRGKIDIYNYSRKPGAGNQALLSEFVMANQLKKYFATHINAGDFHILKTTHSNIFAYAISYNRTTILVVGNINFHSYARGEVKLPKFNPELNTMPIKITNAPLLEKNKINFNLDAGEIQILVINDYEI